MRKRRFVVFGTALVAVLAAVFAAAAISPGSSHREAPLSALDPTGDDTDVYAFKAPDAPNSLTLVANWIPFEDPAGGPNFYRFDDRATYYMNVDNTGDGAYDIRYRFRFRTSVGDPNSFLYAAPTVDSIDSPNLNVKQSYSVVREDWSDGHLVHENALARNVPVAPDNVGPKTIPNYGAVANQAITHLPGGSRVFAGQRDDPFFGDIGAAFDLVAIRQGTGATGGGKDFFAGYAVHEIALQVPVAMLDNASHVIGMWTATDRPRLQVNQGKGKSNWVQVSRLGNPLINELLIPTQLKDKWNATTPANDKQFEQYYLAPSLAALLNKLYPQFGPFKETDRTDLVAVLGTGLQTPKLNYTGPTFADELRLNLSIAPTAPVGEGNRLGVLGNDLAGWPNGRRLEDDVIDIAERAVGGALIGHALPLGDGVDANDVLYQQSFPYEADPFSGFDNTKGQLYPTHP
jgi:hypothetical protein